MLNYQDRLNRVVTHIHEHLEADLDLNTLAEIACLSPYHWHRIYHAVYGETLAATVKRQRLHRAAGLLAYSAKPIAEVSRKSGYENLQSFTRIFRAEYGMPPAQYRKEGSHAQFATRTVVGTQSAFNVEIRTVPAISAIAVDHLGSYMEIAKAFDVLYGWLITHGHIASVTRSIGLYLDDPTIVPAKALRSKACVVLRDAIAIDPPIGHVELRPGPYAVLRHKGPYADMKAAYEWLYGAWLVQSGLEVADAPGFEEYLNSPRDTAPAELLSDIYLPLRSASLDPTEARSNGGPCRSQTGGRLLTSG
ncbi:MAG: AraC family transcriptional regulator [bacterium]